MTTGSNGSPPTQPMRRDPRRAREVDVVYHLVHSLGQRRLRGAGSRRRDGGRGRRGGGRRGADRVSRRARRGLAGLSPHLRSRAETAEILAGGPVPVTTLRAAMIVGPGSAAFETIVALVDRLPVMMCPRWVSVETQPVALADVLAVARRRVRQRGDLRPDLRSRWPRGDDLSNDDGASRTPPRQAADSDRGPVPDAKALVAVAAPRHARERRRRAAARRGAPRSRRRARRSDLGPRRARPRTTFDDAVRTALEAQT